MSAPQIVSLAQAGIAQPFGLTEWTPGNPTGHTVHWEGAGGHADHSYCTGEWKSIDAYHRSHDYVMVAYNWGVCNHGVIYQGRPIGYQSAAQRDGNRTHVAICYVAGPSFPFTSAAKNAIAWLIQNGPGAARGHAICHRDEPSCSTSCPGDEIAAWVHNGGYAGVVTPAPRPVPSPTPVPLPPSGFHHPTLRLGSVGPAVMELQRKLVGGAGQRIAVDGDFGPMTRNAVINLQKWCHLTIDGVAGPQTWNTLDFVAALRGIH